MPGLLFLFVFTLPQIDLYEILMLGKNVGSCVSYNDTQLLIFPCSDSVYFRRLFPSHYQSRRQLLQVERSWFSSISPKSKHSLQPLFSSLSLSLSPHFVGKLSTFHPTTLFPAKTMLPTINSINLRKMPFVSI